MSKKLKSDKGEQSISVNSTINDKDGLNKKDLIADVVKKTKLSNVQVSSIINQFLSSILNAVSKKQKVTLVGFLSIRFKHRDAHMARNPRTGDTFMTEEKTAVMIKTGKILQSAVNSTKK